MYIGLKTLIMFCIVLVCWLFLDQNRKEVSLAVICIWYNILCYWYEILMWRIHYDSKWEL